MTSLYLLVLIVKRAMCFAKSALRSLISEQILLFVLLFHSFAVLLPYDELETITIQQATWPRASPFAT